MNVNREAFIGRVRKNRKPRDTDVRYHNAINRAFLSVFGWKARGQGLFVTGDQKFAEVYGIPYLIFPVGDFKFVYSPVFKDLWLGAGVSDEMFMQTLQLDNKRELNKLWWGDNSAAGRYKILAKHPEIMEAFVRKYYTDQNFHRGVTLGREIMINCDKYVAIQKYTYDEDNIHQRLFKGSK